jgi:hypothetical protein
VLRTVAGLRRGTEGNGLVARWAHSPLGNERTVIDFEIACLSKSTHFAIEARWNSLQVPTLSR